MRSSSFLDEQIGKGTGCSDPVDASQRLEYWLQGCARIAATDSAGSYAAAGLGGVGCGSYTSDASTTHLPLFQNYAVDHVSIERCKSE